jgi:transposase-like protein
VEYSTGLKSNMVRKMAGPEGVSATSLAREVGIPQSTLSRWLRAAGTVAGLSTAPSAQGREQPMTPRRPRDWSPEEKLNAVFEAQALGEDELGAFLRRKGLHEAQLKEWRTLILTGLQGHRQCAAARPSTADAGRIRELEKELDRKDKALAETAALLVLQKKVQALWGDADAPTGKKSGR